MEPAPSVVPEGEDGTAPRYDVALGGQYRVMLNATDFGWHSGSLSDSQASMNFANQRLRTWLNLHETTRNDHGAMLQLEIGHTLWGDDFDAPKTNAANGVEVGLELRRGYLWYMPGDGLRLRAGILNWSDRFGERPGFSREINAVDAYDTFQAPLANSIWDFNVGGFEVEGGFETDVHYRLAAMVLSAGTNTLTGDGSALLFAGDLDVETGDALIGGSIYALIDDGTYSYGTFGGPGVAYESSWDVWAGLRAHLGGDPWTASFFAIVNAGKTLNSAPDWTHTGWAFKVAGSYALGDGKLSAQMLYATGNSGASATRSGEFRTIAQSERDNFGAQGYWSFLGLTSPSGPGDVNDLGVSVQNRGLGLVTLQAVYEHTFSDTLGGALAIGWLQAAESRPASGAKSMGFEALVSLHVALSGSLGLDLGGSYFQPGDFYKATPASPDSDPLYELFVRLQLEF